MTSARDEYDSPWKEALEIYLRSFLELCFPQVAEAIDWDRGIEFLDKELQEGVRDADLARNGGVEATVGSGCVGELGGATDTRGNG